MRVRQLGHGPCLAPESLELVGIARHLAVHQLDRHLTLERLVEGAVHRRHAAGADAGLEPVPAAEGRSEQGGHLPGLILRHATVTYRHAAEQVQGCRG
jgi:hypothetical protein